MERLVEKFKGIDVYDAVVTVRQTSDGQLTGDASGAIIQGIGEDLSNTDGKLSDHETLQIAAKREGVHIKDIAQPRFVKNVYLHSDNSARLVNIVSFLIDGEKRPFNIIDLNSGEVLKHWDGFNTYPCCNKEQYHAFGGNKKMGRRTYGRMPYCLTPTIENGTCYLENEYVRVVDMRNTKNRAITETASFPCDLGYEDKINGALSPATDAFFHGTVVSKMFEEWFGETPLKNKIVLRVHFGDRYENAFWNGDNCTFGDGGWRFYPLTSLDVVGHEIGHGVTEQNSRLEYWDEAGGVNEAFSDIMGEAREAYLLGSDWFHGKKITKKEPYLREFETPENDHHSISHAKYMTEGFDPHLSSGVFRKVWWTVTKEHKVPIRDAFHVFYFANKMYWHSTSDFFDCSCGVMKAAIDLGVDTYPFHAAFSDVGIHSCDVAKHIFTLKNNETQHGIQVSNDINPIFKLKTRTWSKNIIISAKDSSTGGNIAISVAKLHYEFESKYCAGAEVFAEGVNYVVRENDEESEYFIKLSLAAPEFSLGLNGTESRTVLVDLTAGYTCDPDLLQELDYIDGFYMAKDCGLEFSLPE